MTGRCYWEFECVGQFYVAVTYREISRRGNSNDCKFGGNDKSWSLNVHHCGCFLLHNNTETTCTPSRDATKVAVYLDWSAGTLSFYQVSADTLTHICTVYSRFTEPLYPGFGFKVRIGSALSMSMFGSSVSLCCTDDGTTSVCQP